MTLLMIWGVTISGKSISWGTAWRASKTK
jgi:hypothetical protein